MSWTNIDSSWSSSFKCSLKPATPNLDFNSNIPDPATSFAPFRIFNIGNNKPEVSVKDIYNLLKKINTTKIDCKVVDHPKSYPNDEPQRRCPDIKKANIDLNYKPKIKLNEGLKSFLNWAKANYKIYKWLKLV